MKQGNSDLRHFPLHTLQVAFGDVVALSSLKLVFLWLSIVSVCNHFASFTDKH